MNELVNEVVQTNATDSPVGAGTPAKEVKHPEVKNEAEVTKRDA